MGSELYWGFQGTSIYCTQHPYLVKITVVPHRAT
jgi:hypothetical protein